MGKYKKLQNQDDDSALNQNYDDSALDSEDITLDLTTDTTNNINSTTDNNDIQLNRNFTIDENGDIVLPYFVDGLFFSFLFLSPSPNPSLPPSLH